MHSAIVERPIEPGALLAQVARTANGAAVLFVGTVRDVNDGRPVTGIQYAAYTSMAARELDAIVHEAADRWSTPDIVVEHRIGTLELGDISVAIACAHPHRAPSFETARWIIEEIKRRVPIWKLEHYTDGTREWVDPSRVASGAGAP